MPISVANPCQISGVMQVNKYHQGSSWQYRVARVANTMWIDLNPIVHQIGISRPRQKQTPSHQFRSCYKLSMLHTEL
jgi:hypothetical protein